MHITYDLPVSIDDILEAKQRLAGKIYKTGMPRSNYFSERCQGEIFLKFENKFYCDVCNIVQGNIIA